MPKPLHRCLIVVTAFVVCACGDSSSQILEPSPGEPLQFLRVVDYRLSCTAQPSAQHFRFDDQETLDFFWETTDVTCSGSDDQPETAPVVDFDNYFMLGTMLEGECTYSGCGDGGNLFTGVTFEGDSLSVGDRLPSQAELGECLACVQPRDFILVSKQFSNLEVKFESARPIWPDKSDR